MKAALLMALLVNTVLLVNINTADEEELMLLPGIGPVKAKRIVEFRKAHGQFKKVEDLLNVKGIGQKTLAKLKPLITVGEVMPRKVIKKKASSITWGELKRSSSTYR